MFGGGWLGIWGFGGLGVRTRRQELLSEVLASLRFPAESADIKRRVESLIERERLGFSFCLFVVFFFFFGGGGIHIYIYIYTYRYRDIDIMCVCVCASVYIYKYNYIEMHNMGPLILPLAQTHKGNSGCTFHIVVFCRDGGFSARKFEQDWIDQTTAAKKCLPLKLSNLSNHAPTFGIGESWFGKRAGALGRIGCGCEKWDSGCHFLKEGEPPSE